MKNLREFWWLVSFLANFDLSFGRQFFEVRPSNVSVKEGQTAVLQCTVANQANIGQTFWTQNNVGLGFDYELGGYPRYRVTGNHGRGEYHLEITDTQLSDDAEYECQVAPSPGEEGLRASARLNVIVPPEKVTLDGYRSSGTVEIRAGKSLDVSCRAAGGKPAPEVQWHKTENGRTTRVADSEVDVKHERQEDGRVTAIARMFLPVIAADSGSVFTCQVHHQAFPASHSLKADFTLSVIYPSGQPSIQGYDGRTLKAGDRLQLQCIVTNGNPLPQVYWYRNKQIIDRTFSNNQEESINAYEFSVDPSDNDAEYRCEASNTASVSPLSTTLRLKVIYPPETVTITGPDEGKIGDHVELRCETSPSNPPAKISWIFDGRPVDDHPRLHINGLITSSTVNVKLTKEKRDVTVTCSAVNEEIGFANDAQISASKTISIQYPPESVSIYGFEKKAIAAGSSIILTCVSMGGNPKAEITWYKGEKRVTHGVSDPSVTDVNSLRTLTLTVNRDDNGADYKCLASNAAMTRPIEAHAKLSVYFPPDRVLINVAPDKLVAGQIADLTCETAPGNPAPVITWIRKSNSEVLPGQDVSNKSGAYGGWVVKNRLRLVLAPEDDASTFQCKATSSIINESMNQDITLKVVFKPIFALPTPQLIEESEKEYVSFNGFASANPPIVRYEWYKDGVGVGRLDHRRQSQFFVSGHTLNISNIDREDGGSYSCVAQNDEGSTSLVFHLSVKYPAKIISISSPQYADVGGAVSFECEADGFPKPDTMIRWERESVPEYRLRKSYGEHKSYLQIVDIRPEDAGDFTCVAFNGVGEPSRRAAVLLVKQPPVIDRSQIYVKAAAEKGQDAKLTCVADGVPDVSFVWSKEVNGELQPIYEGTENVVIESRPLSARRFQSDLILRNVDEGDYGLYTCIARNQLPNGEDRLTIPLNITSAPDVPNFIHSSVNISHDSVLLMWSPGFNGGFEQGYRVKYHVVGNPSTAKNVELTDGSTSVVIDGLSPTTKYVFYIEAFNRLGKSGFSKEIALETDEAPEVSRQNLEEEIPILIIIFVSLVGILLLALNVVLIFCFIRRHQRRKLQAMDKRKMLDSKKSAPSSADGSDSGEEKAATARLVEPVGRKIQMYSSDASGASGGGVLRPDSQYTDTEPRPRSGYSEDETSEVDSNGQPMFVEHISPHSHATYLLDDRPITYNDGPSNAMYAETLRTNSLQRHLAGGVYNGNSGYQDPKKILYGHMSPGDDAVPPAMGPLRSISQELNNYAPAYSHYNPPPTSATSASRNGLIRRYSPPNHCPTSQQNSSIPTLVQTTNGRPTYAEVRPILTQQNNNGGVVGSQGGSPVLSTFAAPRSSIAGAGSKPDYVDLDCLPGDLV